VEEKVKSTNEPDTKSFIITDESKDLFKLIEVNDTPDAETENI
jgi:hypothetical protein